MNLVQSLTILSSIEEESFQIDLSKDDWIKGKIIKMNWGIKLNDFDETVVSQF